MIIIRIITGRGHRHVTTNTNIITKQRGKIGHAPRSTTMTIPVGHATSSTSTINGHTTSNTITGHGRRHANAAADATITRKRERITRKRGSIIMRGSINISTHRRRAINVNDRRRTSTTTNNRR